MKNRLLSLVSFFKRLFLQPFGQDLSFFIAVLIISSFVEIIYSCIYDKIFIAIYLGMHHFVICYFLTLISGLLQGKIRNLYHIIIYALLFLNSLIDLVCSAIYHNRFCLDYADIIMGTNLNEVLEAIQTYFSFQFVIYFFICLCLVLGLLMVIRRFTPILSLKKQFILLIAVFLSIIFISFNNHKSHWNIVSLGKIQAFMSISTVDLKEYKVNPKLTIVSKATPKNIVLIIGESFSKSHSSLYSYKKRTNPHLDSLRTEGKLYVFENVRTSGLYTIEAFKNIMSTFTSQAADNNILWYKCLTLPEVMHTIGYHTEWISNQSRKGFHDNIITKYAELCDTMIFAGNQYAGQSKSEKDGILIDLVHKAMIDNSKKKNFFVIHMMGSHCAFNIRYPNSFDIFKSKEYEDKPVNQRELLAQYDNSILYNDYVVSSIMNLFKDEESIIIYFPDHGIDVFESTDSYIGHAMKGNSTSCEVASKIPFVIYTSSQYKDKYITECERIKKSRNKKFCTENIIYSLMDILGVKFQDNDDVNIYSLFS